MKRGVLIIAGLAMLLVIVFVVVTLLGQGGQTTQERVLTIYSPFDEKKTYETISAEFLVANPNLKLEFKYVDAKDAKEYEAKVVNEIADGAGPDIWLVRSDWIPKHAAKTTPYLTSSEEIGALKTVLEPAVVDLNIFEEKLYGVPLFADSLAIFYNQTAVDDLSNSLSSSQFDDLIENPTTWAVVKRQAELSTKKTGSVIQTSGLALGTVETGYAPVDIYSAMLIQHGGLLFTEQHDSVALNLAQFKNGKSTFPATTALNLFTSFSKPSQKNYSWNNDLGSAVNAFKTGKALAIIGYRSLLNEIVSGKPDFKISVAPLPQQTDDVDDRVDYGVSWTHVMNANSGNQALAKSYLDYLSSSDALFDYSTEENKTSAAIYSPSSRDLDGLVEANAASQIFKAQQKTIRQTFKPEWQRVDEVVQDLIKLVTNSGQSAQSAVDSAAARLKDLL